MWRRTNRVCSMRLLLSYLVLPYLVLCNTYKQYFECLESFFEKTVIAYYKVTKILCNNPMILVDSDGAWTQWTKDIGKEIECYKRSKVRHKSRK